MHFSSLKAMYPWHGKEKLFNNTCQSMVRKTLFMTIMVGVGSLQWGFVVEERVLVQGSTLIVAWPSRNL
jgi:hypothetical protein